MDSKDIKKKNSMLPSRDVKSNNITPFSKNQSTNKQSFRSSTNYYIINEELKCKLINSLIESNQIVFNDLKDQKRRMDLFRENNLLLMALDRLRISNKLLIRSIQPEKNQWTPFIASPKYQKQVKFSRSTKFDDQKNLENSIAKINETYIVNEAKEEPNSTDLAEEYREIYRSIVGGNKIDLNKHNIFLWLTAFEIYTSKKDDNDRLIKLINYFDTSLQKVIISFVKEKLDYEFVKEKLMKFVCVYLDQSLNPISEKQFNDIAAMFKYFDFTTKEKKYLLNCYCDCVKLLDDSETLSQFGFKTLSLLERCRMNLNEE